MSALTLTTSACYYAKLEVKGNDHSVLRCVFTALLFYDKYQLDSDMFFVVIFHLNFSQLKQIYTFALICSYLSYGIIDRGCACASNTTLNCLRI